MMPAEVIVAWMSDPVCYEAPAMDPRDAMEQTTGGGAYTCDPLEYIGARESNLQDVGEHEGDRMWPHQQREMRDRAIAVGWLDPGTCPHHATDRGQSTHGPWGLMYAYNARHVGACVSSSDFGHPAANAIAAAHKWDTQCREDRPPSWCTTRINTRRRVFRWGRGIVR